MDQSKLEDRKLKEIEHSRKRREVLQGFERIADTHAASQIEKLDELIKDKQQFDYYFANMKYYAVTVKSEEYKHKWLDQRCKPGKKLWTLPAVTVRMVFTPPRRVLNVRASTYRLKAFPTPTKMQKKFGVSGALSVCHDGR